VSKSALAAFRQQHDLTVADHAAVLSKLGWTPLDFESGFRG
jgi:hypothetical protein